MTEELERFLRRRLPDLDLRVISGDEVITIRYALPAERGRRFPILFELRRAEGRWIPDRVIERGLIGEMLEYLTLSVEYRYRKYSYSPSAR